MVCFVDVSWTVGLRGWRGLAIVVLCAPYCCQWFWLERLRIASVRVDWSYSHDYVCCRAPRGAFDVARARCGVGLALPAVRSGAAGA